VWNPSRTTVAGTTAYELRARATDTADNESNWTTPITLIVDTTPPIISFAPNTQNALADGFINANESTLVGLVTDNQQAKNYAFCSPIENSKICDISPLLPPDETSGVWSQQYNVANEDGTLLTINLRGIDGAGNWSSPLTATFSLDGISPVITVLTYIPAVTGSNNVAVLDGGVTDGSGIASMHVRIVDKEGHVQFAPLNVVNGTWSFIPDLPSGEYSLWVEAVDLAGNTGFSERYTLSVGKVYQYLPLIINNEYEPTGPDLIATISLTPSKTNFVEEEPVVLTVVITNIGQTATSAGFWVDAFINPQPIPTQPNIIWNDTCTLTPCYGIAWAVTETLQPGESITLTSTPDSYAGEQTVWPGWFVAGTTEVYVSVDSFNPGVIVGAVAEEDETNNISALRGITVTK
jgi:hypothetical protein